MNVKVNLNLTSRQLSAFENGKNIQIGPENIGGGMEFAVSDLKLVNKINRAVEKGKSVRVNTSDLHMCEHSDVSGGAFNFKRIGRTIDKGFKHNITDHVMHMRNAEHMHDHPVMGGSTYWQRVARRARNTGNDIQRGLDKVIPRQVQRTIKAAAVDKLQNKALSAIAGAGVRRGQKKIQKRIKLPNSQLEYGYSYEELPSSYLEPNNIKSMYRGSSFRGV